MKSLPNYGMTVGGRLFQPRMLEPRTSENGGSCLPTPTVCGNNNRNGLSKNSGDGLSTILKKTKIPTIGANRIQGEREKQISRLETFSWCQNVRRVEDFFQRSDIPEPLICRKNSGIQFRVDRIKSLGNAVVPLQAKTAFEISSRIKHTMHLTTNDKMNTLKRTGRLNNYIQAIISQHEGPLEIIRDERIAL